MKLVLDIEKHITYKFDSYVITYEFFIWINPYVITYGFSNSYISVTYDNFTYKYLSVCNPYVNPNYIWIFNVIYEFRS